MQRFNLLLVSPNPNLGQSAQKTVSRVFRRNFIFEIPSMEEAENLIDKLNMDMILVDLDKVNLDLSALAKSHPNLLVWGFANDPKRVASRMHPTQNRVFAKQDFAQEMGMELKLVKKGLQGSSILPKRMLRTSGSNDFKNFFRLVGAN